MKCEINKNPWEIFEVGGFTSDDISAEKEMALGCCDFTNHKIYLLATLNRSQKWDTLLHELSHAYLRTYQLEQQEVFSEEELCEFVSKHSKSILEVADEYFSLHESLSRLQAQIRD